MTPPPAPTNTNRNVPRGSENSRRHSSAGSSNSSIDGNSSANTGRRRLAALAGTAWLSWSTCTGQLATIAANLTHASDRITCSRPQQFEAVGKEGSDRSVLRGNALTSIIGEQK
jgi:hypothetical protein